jgi:hypothetical protein
MQLNPGTSIRGTVAALTAALLGQNAASAADQNHSDISLLLYSEAQRVSSAEASWNVLKQLNLSYSMGLTLTYDGLTGASPTGATPSNKLQTFTGPSGGTSRVIKPGEIPLDPNFKDNRFAFDGSLSRLLDRLSMVTFGTHLSKEKDYTSLGVNGGITHDFNRKNTTVGLSGSYSHDIAAAVGGIPVPFDSVATSTAIGGGGGGGGEGDGFGDGEQHIGVSGHEIKNTADFVFGVSQILDRRTVLRMNYSFDQSKGYNNDPYKILSVVANQSAAEPGEPVRYVYENRPGLRTKRAVYGEVLRSIARHTVDLSYRYFWDDWGIRSKTADLSVRLQAHDGSALEPHLRWYTQTRANFYHPFLIDGSAYPQYASADSRLANFNAYTIGMKYSFPVGEDSRVMVTAEYYFQRGDTSPPEAFGSLRGYKLFPNMDAGMLRVGYAHNF